MAKKASGEAGSARRADRTSQRDVPTTKNSPQTPEAYSYDQDGNLLSDGRFNYTWDGENRLKVIESLTNAPAASKRRLEMSYDDQSRRLLKRVLVWNAGTNGYQLATEKRYWYDGWNLLGEADSASGRVQTYCWGLDLSGSMQGAGGVGGLLWLNAQSTLNSQPSTHFVAMDGNGNVKALVNAADGTTSATYEYGPFGELIRLDGAVARLNPFRFSTKYQDDETDLIYYGYRFYNQTSGKWLSRDSEDEDGGINLYGFCLDNPVNGYDPYGNDTRFWDGMKCMSDCIQANDPLEAVSQKVLLNLSGMKLPKKLVAKLAQIAGDERLASRILLSLKNPAMSKWTSLPGTVSAVLRAPGRASEFLHGLGAGMGPFWTSYGLYMAAVEAACTGHCCANRTYDSNAGIALPVNAKSLIDKAADLINTAIQYWSN